MPAVLGGIFMTDFDFYGTLRLHASTQAACLIWGFTFHLPITFAVELPYQACIHLKPCTR